MVSVLTLPVVVPFELITRLAASGTTALASESDCQTRLNRRRISRMSELKPLPAHLIGGNFLLAETDPGLVFTPDDLSAEQRLMAQTAGKFMEKDVLPNLDALEHQQEGLTPKIFRKAGELGLLGMEVPTDYNGLGLGKTSGVGVEEQFSRLGGFGVTCGAHCGIGTMPLQYFGT